MNIHSPAYRKAFIRYLRRGDMSFLSLKEEHPTSHYIWRTQGDGNTRPSHAANDGQIFSWNSPPPTGHPGEEPGCRCYAEPFYNTVATKELLLKILNELVATGKKWENLEMSAYFYVGGGVPRTLESIGHFELIRDYYTENYLQRFIDQIREKAASTPDGEMNYDIHNVYSFYDILYSYRNSTMSAQFSGTITTLPLGQRSISGTATFQFYDEFKDPLEFRQIWVGFLNVSGLSEGATEKEWEMAWAELGGSPYSISGNWTMVIQEALNIG